MENKKNVPEIRFKGFTDEWEQCKLFDAIDIGSGMDYKMLEKGDIPVYGTGGYITSVNEFLSETKDAIGIGRKGTIDKPFILKAPFWTVDTLFYCIPKNIDTLKFLYCAFQRVNWKLKDESTGVPSLSKESIYKHEITVPYYNEQKLIGNYFNCIDSLITLHQRKCEKLKELKKSMLEKMFPKNGEKTPEVRFKGFTDEWEQCEFSNMVSIERGGSPRPIENYITRSPKGLNWVKIGDAPSQGNYITKTKEKIIPEGLCHTREVNPGDLILSNSMSFGKPYIMGLKGCIHDGWLAIRNPQEHFDLLFLCFLLGSPSMLRQYKSLAAGSTVNNLNKELVGSTKVIFPCTEEQENVGIFFEDIDNLITLHHRKLAELNNGGKR